MKKPKKPKKGDVVTYHRAKNGAPLGAPLETVEATVEKVHPGKRGEVVDLVVPVVVNGVPEERTLEGITRGSKPHPNRWTDGSESTPDEEETSQSGQESSETNDAATTSEGGDTETADTADTHNPTEPAA